jgi:hypothetical protein
MGEDAAVRPGPTRQECRSVFHFTEHRRRVPLPVRIKADNSSHAIHRRDEVYRTLRVIGGKRGLGLGLYGRDEIR